VSLCGFRAPLQPLAIYHHTEEEGALINSVALHHTNSLWMEQAKDYVFVQQGRGIDPFMPCV
jgi:hypothetical protein